jgi:hypothetical protein
MAWLNLILLLTHTHTVILQVLVRVGTSFRPAWVTPDMIQQGRQCQHSHSERDSKIQVSRQKPLSKPSIFLLVYYYKLYIIGIYCCSERLCMYAYVCSNSEV